MPELNILSMCFLPTSSTSSSVVAILHIDPDHQIWVVCREVDLSEKEISIEPSALLPKSLVHSNASLIIPYEGEAGNQGGVLVLGGGTCRLLKCASAAPQPRSSPENKKKRNRDTIDSGGGDVVVQLPFEEEITA